MSWDATVRQPLRQFHRFAKLNFAMNTLAALFYMRLYSTGLVIVTVLTVLVGSKGVAGLSSSSTTPIDIVLSCCDVLLGVTAALLTSLELKGKAERYHRRACGYGTMSSQLQIDICADATEQRERERLRAMLHALPERLTELEQHADPLPVRYRLQAQTLPAALFYTSTLDEDAAAVTAAAAGQYAEAQEHEGSRDWGNTNILISQVL